MKKITILLFCLWLLVDGQTNAPRQKQSSLQKITNELSILSRLANGIALQKEIDEKTLKLEKLLAELLGVDPDNNGLVDLKKIDLGNIIEDYKKIADAASAIKGSQLSASSIGDKLKALGEMGKDLNALKEGETINLEDILNKATAALDVDKGLFSDETFPDFSTKFQYIFLPAENTKKGESDSSASLSHMHKKLNVFESFCKTLLDYENRMKVLWPMMNATGNLHLLETLATTAREYKESYSDFFALQKNMKIMEQDFEGLETLAGSFANIKSATTTFDYLQKIIEILLKSEVKSRTFTSGFSKGTSDISRLFEDVKGKWLLNTVANNNASGWSNFVSKLDGLKKFNEQAKKPEKSWRLLKEVASLEVIKKSGDLWNAAIEIDIGSISVQQLRKSIADTGNCFQGLAPIETAVDFEKFTESVKRLMSIAESAQKVHKLFSEIAENKILGNKTVFKLLKSKLKKFNENMGVADERSLINSIIEKQDIVKLQKAVLNVNSILKQVKEANVLEVLEQVDDWKFVRNMNNVLKNTNLVTCLECLRQKKLDIDGATKVLEFGSKVRNLGEHHKTDKTAIPSISQFGVFKTDYEHFVNSSIPKSRSKRAASSLFSSLEHALPVSQDLGKGVGLLQKMTALYKNKETLVKVAKSDDVVFVEFKKIFNTVDTSSFKTDIEKTVKDLDNLESYAEKNSDGDLQKIGGIFEQASTIPGISIDSKLLSDPVSTSFKTSPNANIQKSAPSFQILGTLELDYSKHRSDFKSASLSVIKLKNFFDELFSIPVSLSDENKNSDKTSEDMIITIFSIIGSLCIVGLGTWLFVKYIQDQQRRKNRNSFRHLLYAFDKSEMNLVGKKYWKPTTEFDKIVRLPLHDAILEKNWKKFKKEIQKGANVNAYCIASFSLCTPLHIAVEKKLPKYAELLLKNGADTTLLNSNHWPVDYFANRDEKILKVLKKYRGRKLLRKAPPKFTSDNYRLFFHDFPETGEFKAKFRQNVTECIEDATHLVIYTTEDGKVDFDSEFNFHKFVPYFFSGKMVMQTQWLLACVKNKRNLKKDYKFRVETVIADGKEYNTIARIYQDVQERRIPYLFPCKAYFIGNAEDYWVSTARTVNYLGGVSMKLGAMPKFDLHEFSLYYNDNIPPYIVFTEDKEALKKDKDYQYLFEKDAVKFMTKREFVHFVFAYKSRHFQLPGGKRDEQTIQPVDETYKVIFGSTAGVEDEWQFGAIDGLVGFFE